MSDTTPWMEYTKCDETICKGHWMPLSPSACATEERVTELTREVSALRTDMNKLVQHRIDLLKELEKVETLREKGIEENNRLKSELVVLKLRLNDLMREKAD